MHTVLPYEVVTRPKQPLGSLSSSLFGQAGNIPDVPDIALFNYVEADALRTLTTTNGEPEMEYVNLRLQILEQWLQMR